MIYIFVRSKHQDILDQFLNTFTPTTKNHDVMLYVFHPNLSVEETDRVISIKSDNLGNEAYIPHVQKIISGMGKDIYKKRRNFFGVFNDDLIFSDRWLESVMKGLAKYKCVSPGYINTTNSNELSKAVQKTKNNDGVVDLAVGFCQIVDFYVFPYVGMLDPQFDWSCDDLDFIWRLYLRNFESVTLKQITIAHAHGISRNREHNRWVAAETMGKQKFYDKHGLASYRHLRNMYKKHNYFSNFKINE